MLLRVVLICLFVVGCKHSIAETRSNNRIAGKVVEVYDGDTIVFSTTKKNEVVRLIGIDAPETEGNHIVKTQPYGLEAKERLTQLIAGKTVQLESPGRGYYKRLLATVYLDGEDVNLKMVKEGLAVSSKHLYRDAENKAKVERLGLWLQTNPILPKKWRKMYKRIGD